MRVGTAVIDITPPVGAELCGFVARRQPSTGVHDRLLARSLYVESGEEKLLWLHADLIGFERVFVDDLKGVIARRFDLPNNRVVVSATHTHSGPATIHLINCGSYDRGYLADLKERLLDITSGAMLDPEEAGLVLAEGWCELAVDRRGQPTKHSDPRMGVVAWRRANGEYIAVLANYAIHNVALRADNRLISADMAGRAATTLSEALPGRPNMLFTNGACGNLNPPAITSEFIQRGPVESGFDRMEQWGDQMAACAIDALAQPAPANDETLSVRATTFHLQFERFTADDVKQTAARLRATMDRESGYVADRVRDAYRQWEEQALTHVARRDASFSAPLAVQVVRLGPTTFVCLGAEVFSVIGDPLRARSTGPLYVVGYANGDTGYLAPETAYDEGGYEIDSAFAFYGGFPVCRGEFERLQNEVANLVT